MSYNRRSGGYGGGGGNYGGNSYGHGGNNYGGPGNYGGGGGHFNPGGGHFNPGGGHYNPGGGNFNPGGGNFNPGGGHFNPGGGGRFNNYNNYGRNPKMSPWEAGVSPGGGMMPNVHPNQMALANDLLSKLLAPNHQTGYGGGQNWGPNPGMMRRHEPYKHQNRRRPDNRNRRPPPKRDDKKKDSKTEADKNYQSGGAYFYGAKRYIVQEHTDYNGIPTAVLFCHVCQKHMWDSASFEKHVRGRPHELMMTYLDETYKLQVELMRHQIKAAENQREIDLERMQAQNKGKAKPLFRNYCPMCNINFYGPLTGHRKSDRHRKLKQFLHPECKMCDMLFHTRLEWDDHKLSPDHLRRVGDQRRKFNPDLKDDEFELLDVIIIEDELVEVPVVLKTDMIVDLEIKEENVEDNKEKQETTDIKVEGDPVVSVSDIAMKGDDSEVKGGDSEVKEGETEVKEGEAEVKEGEADVKVGETEVKEGETVVKEGETVVKEGETVVKEGETEGNVGKGNEDTKEKVPPVGKKEKDEKYNPAHVVGRELVVKTGGFVCRICSIFMKNKEEAILHCQTAAHYVNFTTITKLHSKINNRKRKMKEELKKNNYGKVINPRETSCERPAKRARIETTTTEAAADPVVDANITAKPEPVVQATEDDDVQEIKVDVPVIEVLDDEVKKESSADEIKNESADVVAEPETLKEEPIFIAPTPPPPVSASVIKTNSPSQRGRGGRGRGMSRRGRSSR